MIFLTDSSDSYAQFITVLVIFVLVLAVTALTTRWIAGYHKQQSVDCNIEIVESARIGNNKFVQILRVGETYFAVAVAKDVVTPLGEIPKEQIKILKSASGSLGFKEFLERSMKKDSSPDTQSKVENHEDKKT